MFLALAHMGNRLPISDRPGGMVRADPRPAIGPMSFRAS
jgi:hypothetical protein